VSGLIYSDAFILHRYAYSETSLLLKILLPDCFITSMIAKGVKNTRRGRGALAGLCEPFYYLNIGFSGRGEVKSLKTIDLIDSGQTRLLGNFLASGFYLNELLISLLGPSICSQELFNSYLQAQKDLSNLNNLKNNNFFELSKILRIFEKKLLEETGHGPNLLVDQNHEEILLDEFYEIMPGCLGRKLGREVGQKLDKNLNKNIYQGEDLLKINNNIFDTPEIIYLAKKIFRELIDLNTHGKILKTRELLRECFNNAEK